MEHVHQCENMKSVGAWIEKNQDDWMLSINRMATVDDLQENHYLEEVGQILAHVAINVLFCPYCGESLDQPAENFMPSFRHNDFSKW